jgi:hypothetical protein
MFGGRDGGRGSELMDACVLCLGSVCFACALCVCVCVCVCASLQEGFACPHPAHLPRGQVGRVGGRGSED